MISQNFSAKKINYVRINECFLMFCSAKCWNYIGVILDNTHGFYLFAYCLASLTSLLVAYFLMWQSRKVGKVAHIQSFTHLKLCHFVILL